MLEHSLLYVMCVKMRAVTPTERDQILPLQSTFVQKCTSSDDPPNPALHFRLVSTCRFLFIIEKFDYYTESLFDCQFSAWTLILYLQFQNYICILTHWCLVHALSTVVLFCEFYSDKDGSTRT